MNLSLDIFDETRTLTEAQVTQLHTTAAKALRRLACTGEVRVRIVNDQVMAAAHEEFAGVAGTTDVLTFDLTDPEEVVRPARPAEAAIAAGEVIGPYTLDTDMLICLDEAQRQAAVREYPFDRELLLYIVHGVLHCIGFDDHDEAEFAAMHATEDAVLKAIGVGAVFNGPAAREG